MDSSVLNARVCDTADICDRTSSPRFLGFLTPQEAAIADKILKNRSIKYNFFGGYDLAERTILACLPDWCDDTDFPISPLTFRFRTCDNLSHRDFLGSLMALGIVRESVGDILVESGLGVVFLKNDICDFVLSQITKVGNCGVEVSKTIDYPLPSAGKLTEFTSTVSSPRLDSIVAAICGCSRGKSNNMITDGIVSVNSLLVEKTTRNVVADDKITVRGMGKFIINSIDGVTKKNRIVLQYSKYI